MFGYRKKWRNMGLDGFNSYIYIDYEWHLNLRHNYGVAAMTGHNAPACDN